MSGGAAPWSPEPIFGDTVAAQSTPGGRSAIAVIRLTGPRAHQIAAARLEKFPESARVAQPTVFRDAEGDAIDHVVVTRYDAPHSYTGEDLVEIATHGGFVAPARVLEQLVLDGARPAGRGEFTRRAFLNGKIDLLQAEAVGDLIDASSRAMARAAMAQLDRGLSRRIEQLRDAVLHVESLLAYDIDFPEEDEGPISRERIAAAGGACLQRVNDLLATAPVGELLREGAPVVIAGRPNVGKSSLFNALIGRSRAIVTDVPGTTRDALEAVVEGARWPLRLVDTAGLRSTTDVVERLGVELSERHIAGAEVVLACGDSDESLQAVRERLGELTTGASILLVRTKSDLADGDGPDAHLSVSAETGDGLRRLLARIEDEVTLRNSAAEPDAPVLTRARHRRALERAREEVSAFLTAWEEGALPATVAATHLRAAAGQLEELIGIVDVEDILERLFAEFCIGK